ncbi:r3h domain containing protein [Moniliophthora roreri]|nr:r3h domain containing protein [Moniliophthora roreri]
MDPLTALVLCTGIFSVYQLGYVPEQRSRKEGRIVSRDESDGSDNDTTQTLIPNTLTSRSLSNKQNGFQFRIITGTRDRRR